VLGGAAVALAFAVVPASALAHGLVGRADLPIPRWLFGWAATLVLVISFAALAVLWREPRLEERGGRRLFAVPRVVDVACGVIGVAIFALLVYAGLAGAQAASTNLVPTFVYVVFWVGFAVFSVLAGDVFRAFNPWRAIARAFSWTAGRRGGERGLPEPLEYPARLGYWPAVVGLVAFVWLELVYAGRDDPSTLAIAALVYAWVQLVGMSLYGIDRWNERGDAFAVYFNLLARLSPWERRGRELWLVRPLSRVTAISLAPGLVAVLCAAIGTTTFDGLSQGPLWRAIVPGLTQPFLGIGFSQEVAFELAMTLGLVATIALVFGFYRLGVQGMHTVGEGHSGAELAERFAHSLAPIAFAYALAHYFSLLAYQGQAVWGLASDPLGTGADLLGTAGAGIDYGVVSATAIWYVQVGALVVGHVCGLILAHDRALIVYREGRAATRSQYWMLLVMIGFTSLGLWLLSALNP
jgi:hypothetical protein